MGVRARGRVFGFIVLAACASGCDPGGTVRQGQTGMYVALGPIEDSASVRLFLNTNGATGLSHSIFRHTPIVVTEKPTDEEFWEFALEYYPPAGATDGAARASASPVFVVGARQACEARRADVEDFVWRSKPCSGPHYFKRTGPPSAPRPYEI